MRQFICSISKYNKQFVWNLIVIKISMAFLVFSCVQTDQKTTYIDGEDLIPPSPSLFSYFTVMGVDSDLDGVRDDVELLINEKFEDPKIRKAAKWKARVLYKIMFQTSSQEALRLTEESREANDCALAVSYYKWIDKSKTDNKWDYSKEVSRWIYDEMINNYWRESQLEKTNKFVPSGSYIVSLGNNLEMLNGCNFKIVNLKRILSHGYESGMYESHSTPEQRDEYLRLLKETK